MSDTNAAGPEAAKPEPSAFRSVLWMLGFLRPVRGLAFQAALFLVLCIVIEVLAVRQAARVVDRVQSRPAIGSPVSAEPGFRAWLFDRARAPDLKLGLAWLVGLSLLLAICTYFREVSAARLSMTKVYFMREALYDQLQQVGQAFHDRVSTGELINRAFTDLQNIRAFIQSALLLTLEIILIVAGYELLLLSRSPWVAGLALLPLPVWLLYIRRFSRKAEPLQKKVMEASDANVSLLTENLAGAHVVRAMSTEQAEIERYERNCDAFLERVLARIRLYADFTPVLRGIAMASHLGLFLTCGALMIRGRMQTGDVLMLGAAMAAILGRFQQVAVINDQYQSAIVSARRLREVLQVARPGADRPAPPSLADGPGAVDFDGVSFGYRDLPSVLDDVSFHVPGGALVAIVGPTGSGKSTLVQLIARLYDPRRGRIMIDGQDLRDVSIDSVRTQVAVVFQETFLFSDSVDANVAYGRPEITRAQIELVARQAQADEFIRGLPRGYDSPLGERGANLSGGQRQRVALARALAMQPRILILDDATASVDPETESLIHQAIRREVPRRTTIVVAHRLSTVRDADLVLVIESGRITQQGTHEQLLAQPGHYREIAAVQLFGESIALTAAGELPSHQARVANDPGAVQAAAQAGRAAQESTAGEER